MGISEQDAIKELQTRETIFVAYSQATKLPYVICDEESFNDQVWVFATEEEINNAYNALAEAMTSLVRKANKDELKNALDKAADILNNKENYTESSLAGLEEAKNAAQTVYDKEGATQDEIGEALKKLITEILEVRLLGDVNLNGVVDSEDASDVLKYNVELEALSQEQLDAADVNRDKAADSSDAGMILQYAAEKIEKF